MSKVTATLVALMFLLAIALTAAVIGLRDGDGWLRTVDEAILHGIAVYRSDGATVWALNLTALGSTPVLTVLSVFTCGFLLIRRDRRTALHLAIVAIGAGVLTRTIKAMLGRERPDLFEHLSRETSLSFPSGHALASTAIYITLSLIIARKLADKSERFFIYCACLIIVAVVGVSRLYLAVHFPSDVLGGTAIGITWALLVAASFQKSRVEALN